MKEIIVSKSGPIYTISDALKLVAFGNKTTIILKEGIYKEKVVIDKPYITIKGQGKDKSIITYDDYSQKIHKDGRDYNTFRTPTMLVKEDHVTLLDLEVRNSSNPKGGQAVALAIYGNYFVAKNCLFSSYHDTLFLGPLPDDLKERYATFLPRDILFKEGNLISRFETCDIKGSIDYIFGCGQSLFKNCNIISLDQGFVVAPGHSLFTKEGFIFLECHFINNTHVMNNVYLSRPWRPYGKSVFLKCEYDNHIIKEGLTPWHNKTPFLYSRYFEYPMVFGRVPYMLPLNTYQYEKYLTIVTSFMNF